MKKLPAFALALVFALFAFVVLSSKDVGVDLLMENYTYIDSDFREIEGVNTHFRITGSGPDLLLIHGTSSSLHTWEDWTNELSNSFRIISIDMPGFGLTGPFQEGEYTLDHWVDFLHQFTQSLNLDTFYLGGNSLGGNIAVRYAEKYPDQVRKLVLLDPSGLPAKVENDPPLAFKMANNPFLKYIVRYVTPKSLVEKSVKQVFADPSKVSSALVDRYHMMALREGNRDAMIKIFSTPRDMDTTKLLKVGIPTIILWGAQDQLIPVEDAYRWKSILSNSTLIVYENVGHVPMEEIPTQSSRDAMRFLISE